jgi:hypothetical protein
MFLWGVEFSKTDSKHAAENKKQWEEEMYPRFKTFYDRAMITHHVCQDIYGDDECIFEDDKYAHFDDR